LNKTFIKEALRLRCDKIIAQMGEDIRKRQETLAKQRQAQARYFEQEEAKENEERDLKRRIGSEQAKKPA